MNLTRLIYTESEIHEITPATNRVDGLANR